MLNTKQKSKTFYSEKDIDVNLEMKRTQVREITKK
jgi:hypothetical protein